MINFVPLIPLCLLVVAALVYIYRDAGQQREKREQRQKEAETKE